MDISDDHTLLESVENPLQKALLLGKPNKIVLYFFRLYPPDTLNQLIDKARSHLGIPMADILPRAAPKYSGGIGVASLANAGSAFQVSGEATPIPPEYFGAALGRISAIG